MARRPIKKNKYIQGLHDRIYDAVLNPMLLADVQKDICAFTGGIGSHVVLFDKGRAPLESIIHSSLGSDFATSMENDYFDWYHQFDDDRVQSVILNGRGIVVTNDDLTPRIGRSSDPLYNEYFKKYKSEVQLIYGTQITENKAMTLCQARSKKEGEYSLDERSHFVRLADHFSRSLGMRQKVISNFGIEASVQDLAFSRKLPVLAVNKDQQVIWHNSSAEKELKQNATVSLSFGRLVLSDNLAQKQFEKLLGQAIILGLSDKSRVGDMRLNGIARPCLLSVFSTTKESALFSDSEAIAIVVIKDVENNELPSNKLLQDFYLLTPAEARLCLGVASGLKVQEYAAKNGLSVHTVRGTLKIVMEKTLTHSQSGLVRAVYALVN